MLRAPVGVNKMGGFLTSDRELMTCSFEMPSRFCIDLVLFALVLFALGHFLSIPAPFPLQMHLEM